MTHPPARIRTAADDAVLVEYPDASEFEANAAAVALARWLQGRRLPGLFDAIPGARSLFCAFDPRGLSHDALAAEIAAAEPEAEAEAERPPSREHRIAVHYGGEDGPDLPALAARAGLPEEELARRHAAAIYRVAFLGFAPGFAYLMGLPAELAAPRRPTPRTRVPSGALAVAGPYTGIYPGATPGGWNLIGRARASLFDPSRRPPTLLLPGDRVCFETGLSAEPAPAESEAPGAAAGSSAGEPLFRVLDPGLWCAAAGAPRRGRGAWGAPPSGAMDFDALARGNALVGNSPGAAGLEIAVSGPELELLADATLVLSGAPCEATADGRPIARGEPARLRAGARLRLGPVRPGVRAYLCVAGGLADESPVETPSRLAAGALLHGAGGKVLPAEGAAPLPAFAAENDPVVRILLGPQQDHFTSGGIATLIGSTYRVSSASDRRGVRLEGPSLEPAGGADIPPEGTALGAIQVPADGQPIVLGPDRPVTGGYPKIATVIAADFGRIAQARPGTALRFRPVSLAEALEARGRMLWP
ncbi:MAG: 5-oxoprolinase subunit PxpB [Acidobacteriota bacterium]